MLQPDGRERRRVVSDRAADAIGRTARDMAGSDGSHDELLQGVRHDLLVDCAT